MNKKITKTVLLLSVLPWQLFAQIPVQTTCGIPSSNLCASNTDSVVLGTKDAVNGIPFRANGVSATTRQVVYSRAVLKSAGFTNGIITSLGLFVDSKKPNTYSNFSISLACVSGTTTTLNGFVGTPVQVYSSSAYTPVTGLNTFPLSGNGFALDSSSSLIVQFCYYNAGTLTKDDSVEVQTVGTLTGNNTCSGNCISYVVNSSNSNIKACIPLDNTAFAFVYRPVLKIGYCHGSNGIPTSIETNIISNGGTKLFPVPASNKLTFTSTDIPLGLFKVKTFDVLGNLSLSKSFEKTTKDQLFELEVGTLPSGIYFLQIGEGVSSKLIRFTKE